MDEKILRLKELQRIGLALRALDEQRQQGPLRLAALEESYQATSASVGAVKHRHDALKQESVTLEIEQKEYQQKLGKFQAQLMEVKNSKEYSAVLKEIDTAKSEISRRDDEILQRMQEIETLQHDLPEAEANLLAETGAFEEQRALILAELKSFEARRAALDEERKRVEAHLPRETVALFHRVAEARQGVAMARVTDAVCTACNVRLRPQMFSELKRAEALITCDSCRRFLYYESGGPAPAQSDAASPKP